MVKLYDGGVYLVNGREIVTDPAALPGKCGRNVTKEEAEQGTIAYGILKAHNKSGDMQNLRMRFDSLTSHDITYVGIIQTARASGMKKFPMPYVLTNCHNSLCAVGGTINEDDHMFALSAAHKYGGIYVPTNMAVIHSYNREMMSGCGRMILGSDSHTRYGALGTLAVGEGGGELAKQLVGRTYDVARPGVVAIYLPGKPRDGVGPQDVALSIIGAVYAKGYVKNKVMEFVGPGVANLPIEYRNGIDVMTTETTCWSSIWETDQNTKDYLTIHGRPEAFKPLKPAEVAYYDGCVYVDLSTVECTIALPMHPSYTYAISELKANAADILHECQEKANAQITGAKLDLMSKIRGGEIWVDQGLVAGCSGGTFDNVCAVADILRGHSCGNGEFKMSVYPGSMPAYIQLMKNGALTDIASAGAIIRECFCGPCFGAGDVPGNDALSIRHTTRNFPNREGSKPASGQLSGVMLMDARSIAATARNHGVLTAATEIDYTMPAPHTEAFDGSVYQKRCYFGFGKADPNAELRFGPNITEWPKIPALPENLLMELACVIHDPVTTTDELIPSGETSSYRSNPLKLATFALSRRDPQYVGRANAIAALESARKDGTLDVETAALIEGCGGTLENTGIGSVIFANKPGDGSAREQAASCQRVLGGCANICYEYATKRYRSNCINWGMLPFHIDADVKFDFEPGDRIFVPNVSAAVRSGSRCIPAMVIRRSAAKVPLLLRLPELTADERQILLDGCLMNYYAANHTKENA